MENAKADAILMHPLPRNNEISIDMDTDKRSVYFEQIKNGVEIRTALIDYILDHCKTNPMLP
jgi:aspartate carbamoyltransferase catalytic subunit